MKEGFKLSEAFCLDFFFSVKVLARDLFLVGFVCSPEGVASGLNKVLDGVKLSAMVAEQGEDFFSVVFSVLIKLFKERMCVFVAHGCSVL